MKKWRVRIILFAFVVLVVGIVLWTRGTEMKGLVTVAGLTVHHLDANGEPALNPAIFLIPGAGDDDTISFGPVKLVPGWRFALLTNSANGFIEAGFLPKGLLFDRANKDLQLGIIDARLLDCEWKLRVFVSWKWEVKLGRFAWSTRLPDEVWESGVMLPAPNWKWKEAPMRFDSSVTDPATKFMDKEEVSLSESLALPAEYNLFDARNPMRSFDAARSKE